MSESGMIGIVGGMGPQAGLDLAGKILSHTLARKDQDHVPMALLSFPGRIPDRTAFLSGSEPDNPAAAILAILGQLEALGATVAGIPCNTSHSAAIFGPLTRALGERGSRLRLLDMIEETVRHVESDPAGVRCAGLLATLGTYRSGAYAERFAASKVRLIAPQASTCADIHAAIYDTGWGIKATGLPVRAEARDRLLAAVAELRERGAETVILGCTEIPLAIGPADVPRLPLVDPTTVLARALLRAAAPDRLAPLP